MKAYTNLEQSKKLAEFLPLESADMEFMFLKKDNSMVSNVPFIKDGYEEPDCSYNMIPCWSLAALLDYLRKIELFPSMETDEDGVVMYISCYNADGIYSIDTKAADFVDAYYDMIVKLHEQHII